MEKAQDMSQHDRRIEIIDRSTDLFLENGFSGTSMTKIAAACGMTKASLYHHFTGKEDLFVACVTHGYGSALRALEAIVADKTTSPVLQFEAALTALYDTTITSQVGRMSPLIAEVSRAFPSVARSFHTEYISPQQYLLWRIVEAGISSGDFQDVDRKLLLHLVFGPMVTLSLSREMFASFDDLDDHFPVPALRDGHIEAIMGLLKSS